MTQPPDLDGWLAYCETCHADRHAQLHHERDVGTGEAYYEYVCSECFSILLTITQANPQEREKRPFQSSLS